MRGSLHLSDMTTQLVVAFIHLFMASRSVVTGYCFKLIGNYFSLMASVQQDPGRNFPAGNHPTRTQAVWMRDRVRQPQHFLSLRQAHAPF